VAANFISGIFILLDQPFVRGDSIQIGQMELIFRQEKQPLDHVYAKGVELFPPPKVGAVEGPPPPPGVRMRRVKVECVHRGPCTHRVDCTHPQPCIHQVPCKHEAPCVHRTPCVHPVPCAHRQACVHRVECRHKVDCVHTVPCVHAEHECDYLHEFDLDWAGNRVACAHRVPCRHFRHRFDFLHNFDYAHDWDFEHEYDTVHDYDMAHDFDTEHPFDPLHDFDMAHAWDPVHEFDLAHVWDLVHDYDVVTPSEPVSENQVPISVSEVPRISVEELKERLDKGEEIVVGDTRPASVSDIKHIPGAISVPASAIYNESPLDELPLDQEIVLYCT